MAVTILVRPESIPRRNADTPFGSADASERELSLTFDAPRFVIGRGDGCELRLPDPSVSHRHASIRQRGAEYVILDEGSTNGTYLGKVALPPHSPRVLRSGELLRVGRVWLEVRIVPAVIKSATAMAAKELALELVSRGLAVQGEDPRPRLFVLEGPDEGKELRIGEIGRSYAVGRSKECDLVLEDPEASRRHIEVSRKGEHLMVRELAQKGGTELEGVPLSPGDTLWKQGQVLALAQDLLIFEYPAAEALAELEQSRDEAMSPNDAVPELKTESDPPAEMPPAVAPIARQRQRIETSRQTAEGDWSLTDAAVVLLSLGVLVLSIVGLWWLLKL